MRSAHSHIIIVAVFWTWFSLPAGAQSYVEHLRQDLTAPALFALGVGFFDGTADVLKHHYNQSVFPQSDGIGDFFLVGGGKRSFWDPAVSWQNKYRSWPTDTRPAFPGAKTWAVAATDGWHLVKFMRNRSLGGAIITYRIGEKRPWWWYAADLCILSLTQAAGWHLADETLRRGR